MIVTAADLLQLKEFQNEDEMVLERKLKAVEIMIRSKTNNNFQNRLIRFEAPSTTDRLLGASPYLEAGDTLQISESGVNDGLYVVKSVDDGETVIEGKLYPVGHNLVTKVEYPEDIKEGVINLLIWEKGNRKKVGIKSETLSRHSVTYFDLDTDNQDMGYPASLMGFLKPYMKARF